MRRPRIFLASLARSLVSRRARCKRVLAAAARSIKKKRERERERDAFQINVVDYFARMTAFAFNLQNFSLVFRARNKAMCARLDRQKTRSRAHARGDLFSVIARISE